MSQPFRAGVVLRATSGERAKETRDAGSDDNPAEKAAKEFETSVVDPLVKKTQENSGLDISGFNKTADSAGQDDVGAFPEVMSFAGLAPEVINGRGAMVGMLAAFLAEISTGDPVLVQVQRAPLVIGVIFGLVILGSVVPIIRNADLSRKGFGPFTPRAEVWNGRLAMVAFASLLMVETFKAGPGLVL